MIDREFSVRDYEQGFRDGKHEANAEIERIRQEIKQNEVDLEEYRLDVERLRAALEKISTWPDHRLPSPRDIARAALEGK